MRSATIVLTLAAFVGALGCSWLLGSGTGESKKLQGPEWTGQGAQGISQAEAERFQGFALYWLGPSFAGYNLQAILSTGDEVIFIYGSCTRPRGSDGGCSLPLQVHAEPACSVPPELATQFAFRGPPQQFRGQALIVRREVAAMGEATARIWTEDASIWLDIPIAPERLEEALQALAGLNRAHIGPGDELPPPDLGACT